MQSSGGHPPTPGPPRVALFGTFDVDNYGDHLFPRVAAPELGRRLPGVGVPWAPSGDGGRRLRAALAARPYVTVRDRHSAQRLAEAGVERPIEVVPDSALLLDRILPPRALRDRLDRLRREGFYPGTVLRPGDGSAGGPAPLVVQGCDLLQPHLGAVVGAMTRWQAGRPIPLEVVVIETGRCRGDGV